MMIQSETSDGSNGCKQTIVALRTNLTGRYNAVRVMAVTITDDVLAAAHLSELELKREIAVTLFQQERLTLAQASRLAEMTQLGFQSVLAERRIPVHYGVDEFHEDLQNNPSRS